MSMTDPIADLLTRIRNAQMAAHDSVYIPYSKIKHSIAGILEEEGYILGHNLTEKDGHQGINVVLKYLSDRTPAIRKMRRISKPGRRVYVKNDRIPSSQGGLGIVILSTSSGLMTDKSARSQKVGGELLCEIY
ncbi:MAG TPA: 30S ribosomal protein S8 [Acidobacteriota bacterium]|nr:30S ribosomal protein S8 [Acidobacteriota bacterium]